MPTFTLEELQKRNKKTTSNNGGNQTFTLEQLQRKSNPPVNNRGFLTDTINALGATAGGIVGGGVGSFGGPGGTIAGSVIGADIGGQITEGILQTGEKMQGTRQGYDTKQIAGTGLVSGITQGVFEVGALALKPVGKAIGSVLSSISSYPKEVVDRVLGKALPTTIKQQIRESAQLDAKAFTQYEKEGMSQMLRDAKGFLKPEEIQRSVSDMTGRVFGVQKGGTYAKQILSSLKGKQYKTLDELGNDVLKTVNKLKFPEVTAMQQAGQTAAQKGLNEGEQAMSNMVREASQGISNYYSALKKSFAGSLEQIKKIYPQMGTKEAAALQGKHTLQLGKFLKDTVDTLGNHNIGIDMEGTLSFQHAVKADATILNQSERNTIQQAFNQVRKLMRNTSPDNVVSVLQNLSQLSKYTEGQVTHSSSLVIGMKQQLEKFMEQNNIYPELLTVRKSYAMGLSQLSEWRKLIPPLKKLDATTMKQTMIKLRQMYSYGREGIVESLDKLNPDIASTMAGNIVGKQAFESTTAKGIMNPQSLVTKVLEAIPDFATRELTRAGTPAAKMKVISKYAGPIIKAIGQDLVQLLTQQQSSTDSTDTNR